MNDSLLSMPSQFPTLPTERLRPAPQDLQQQQLLPDYQLAQKELPLKERQQRQELRKPQERQQERQQERHQQQPSRTSLEAYSEALRQKMQATLQDESQTLAEQRHQQEQQKTTAALRQQMMQAQAKTKAADDMMLPEGALSLQRTLSQTQMHANARRQQPEPLEHRQPQQSRHTYFRSRSFLPTATSLF
jgi:phosphatidate phosphatase PAH1